MKTDEFPTYLVVVVMLSLILLSFLALKAPFIYSATYGPNYENVSVDTTVNITQSKPTVVSVVFVNDSNITLNAGTYRTIICNATIRDYNGYDDINKTNATFWDDNNANQDDPLNNNTVYRNTSCTNVGNDGQYLSYWECGFNVLYYANNGSNWKCNVTTIDKYEFESSGYNITVIDPLYALNVTSEIDYGQMAVEDTSTSSQTANITNFGNMNINVSLYGYGGDDFATGNGLAFVCEVGNISVGNERYSLNDVAWASMINLTNKSTILTNLTINKRTINETINTTYWRLYVPPNPFGLCNGTVVFAAETP